MRTLIFLALTGLLVNSSALADMQVNRVPGGFPTINMCASGFNGNPTSGCYTNDFTCRNDFPGLYLNYPTGDVRVDPDGMRFIFNCAYVLTGSVVNPPLTPTCPPGFAGSLVDSMHFTCVRTGVRCPPPPAGLSGGGSPDRVPGVTPYSIRFSYVCKTFKIPQVIYYQKPVLRIPGPPPPELNQGQLQQHGGTLIH